MIAALHKVKHINTHRPVYDALYPGFSVSVQFIVPVLMRWWT